MSKAEKTKEFIIQRSAPIFNIKGYAGTSLNDLIIATGLTKGSIYGNFENKDEVAIAVYKYNVELMGQRISEFLRTKKTLTEKLIGIGEYYRVNWQQVFERGGCPIQNASIEADDNLSFMKKHVQLSITNWASSVGRIIEKGKEVGEFKKSINSEEYAYTILSILEGGMMMGKIMNSQKLLFSALDRINTIIINEIKK